MSRSSEISRKSSKETNGVKFQHLPDVLALKEKAKSSEREHEAAVKGPKDIHLLQKSQKNKRGQNRVIFDQSGPFFLCFMPLH